MKRPENSYNGIFNRIESAKGQCDKFVIDISLIVQKQGYDLDKLMEQIKSVFSSKYTKHAIELIVINNNEIIRAFER